MVTSSLNEYPDHLGNKVVVRGEATDRCLKRRRASLSAAGFVKIFKDDVNGFSSISSICFTHIHYKDSRLI